MTSTASSDYEKNTETQISEGADLVVTVGFLMGDATAAMAKKYPDVKFVIVDQKAGRKPLASDMGSSL